MTCRDGCSSAAGLHEGFWWSEGGLLPDERQYGESRAAGSNMENIWRIWQGASPHFYIVVHDFFTSVDYLLYVASILLYGSMLMIISVMASVTI